MKKILAAHICFILFVSFAQGQSVGIGTGNPNSSALLDVTSTNKGLLIPRMDNIAMRGISLPAEGLMVYNTTDSSFYTYRSRWRRMSLTLPYRDTVNTTVTGLYIIQEGIGNGITCFNNNNKTAIAGFAQDLFSNPSATNSIGVMGVNLNTNNWGVGIFGQHSGSGTGILGRVLLSDPNAVAIYGEAFGTSTGIKGKTTGTGIGVKGEAGENGSGVSGSATGTNGYGVLGSNYGADGYGVSGQSGSSGTGVFGFSNTGIGGRFLSITGIALKTEGPLQLTGIGEAAGKVLLSSSDGSANWGNMTRTEVLTIPGSAFKSENSIADYFAINGEAYSAGTGYQLFLETPLLLPNSAQLVGMTAYVMDNSLAKGITISLRKYLNLSGGGIDIATVGTTAADITGGYFSIAASLSYTINNYNENYVLEVKPTGDQVWPASDLRIKAVQLVYSYAVNQ